MGIAYGHHQLTYSETIGIAEINLSQVIDSDTQDSEIRECIAPHEFELLLAPVSQSGCTSVRAGNHMC